MFFISSAIEIIFSNIELLLAVPGYCKGKQGYSHPNTRSNSGDQYKPATKYSHGDDIISSAVISTAHKGSAKHALLIITTT